MKKTKSSSESEEPRAKSQEFDNFARLAKALVSVPKKEVEREKERQEKDKKPIPR